MKGGLLSCISVGESPEASTGDKVLGNLKSVTRKGLGREDGVEESDVGRDLCCDCGRFGRRGEAVFDIEGFGFDAAEGVRYDERGPVYSQLA